MDNPALIRPMFPIFSHHPGLAYLDNAATAQKPAVVVHALSQFYEKENANPHRGIYPLGAQASQNMEAVRQKTARFLKARSAQNIVFTAGATAAINLVAQSFLAGRLLPGDEVVTTALEHHANLIPWQQACKNAKANLRIVPINNAGELDVQAYEQMLSPKTKLVSLAHISNSLGTINPVEEFVRLAQHRGIPVLVDGAQSAAHYEVDVQALGVDFFVYSAHKVYGPMGVGVLYVQEDRFAEMKPSWFGGGAVRDVRFDSTVFSAPPHCFEPGTPNLGNIVGLGAALDFLELLDHAAIRSRLRLLAANAAEELHQINGLSIIGTANDKAPVLSFIIKNIHPHDLATFLGLENIAVRAGHHCTQPVMDFFGLAGTTRVSLAAYNTEEEIERLILAVKEATAFFGA